MANWPMLPASDPMAIATIGGCPIFGISGASRRPATMLVTLNIAGASAEIKNRPLVFNTPMMAAAVATKSKNGDMICAIFAASSTLPG